MVGGPKLARTALMGLIFMFIYATFSFLIYKPYIEDLVPGDDAPPPAAIAAGGEEAANAGDNATDNATEAAGGDVKVTTITAFQFIYWHVVEGLRANGDWSKQYTIHNHHD